MPSREDYERAKMRLSARAYIDSERDELDTVFAYVAQLESRPLPDEVAEAVDSRAEEALLWLCYEHQPRMCRGCTRGDEPALPNFAECAEDARCFFGASLANITRALRGEE